MEEKHLMVAHSQECCQWHATHSPSRSPPFAPAWSFRTAGQGGRCSPGQSGVLLGLCPRARFETVGTGEPQLYSASSRFQTKSRSFYSKIMTIFLNFNFFSIIVDIQY